MKKAFESRLNAVKWFITNLSTVVTVFESRIEKLQGGEVTQKDLDDLARVEELIGEINDILMGNN